MTTLTEQLNAGASIQKNGCTLVIKGDRFHMSIGASVHSIDVELSCEARLVAHWLGFVDSVGVVEVKKVVKKVVREYVLTFTATEAAYGNGRMSDTGTETVFAKDRNEAMRKGRDIVREVEGPYGRKLKISARLAD